MKGSFIRKSVPPARMGLDGLPVWEWGAEKREYMLSSCVCVFLCVCVCVCVPRLRTT